MMHRPGDLTEEAVRQGLRQLGIDTSELSYAAVGFGDHHWYVTDDRGVPWFATVADLDHKPHCGKDAATALAGLRRAMRTAADLREAGLEFVVAPAGHGEPVVALETRYALSVFPVVDGQSGHFGQELTPRDSELVQELFARLHSTRAPKETPRATLAPMGRGRLEAILDAPGRNWSDGPYGQPARRLVTEQADVIRAGLTAFDQAAERVRDADHVVTHGEPHPGNLIRGADGYRLVDWDTVGLAIPERDLSLLSDDPADLSRYRDLTGHQPSAEALELYRLRWALVDVIEFVEWFRAPHAHDPDTEVAWTSFQATMSVLASRCRAR